MFGVKIIMGVTVAIARVAADTSGGIQNITTTNLNDLIPKAVYFIYSIGITDDTPVANASFGVGAATSTSERWSTCFSVENGQGTTDSGRNGDSSNCIIILDGNGATDGLADFVKFIPNGVRINWSTAPSSAYGITAVFFAGTDVSAQGGTFTAENASGDTVDVNGVGFEPDIVLLVTPGLTTFTSSGGNAYLSVGAAVNDGSDTQSCWYFYDNTNVGTVDVGGLISDTYGTGQHNSSGWIWGGEIGSFDANGFSCTTREGASGSDVVAYLAIAFNGAVDFALDVINTPIVTGNQDQTFAGFTPQAVICGLTHLTAVNTTTTSGDAGSVGVCAFDEKSEYCTSVQDEDGEATSDTQSIIDSQSVNMPNDDGTDGHVASFVSFDANGWTWDFTTTEGTAVKYWALAIEEEDVIPPETPPSYHQSRALSVNVYTPTIGSYTVRGIYEGEIGKNVNSYSHTLGTSGGYISAAFTIYDRLSKLEDWINGLGRHIEVYDPALDRIWEGLVNRVTLNVGGLSVVRGPLTSIANKIYVVYSAVDTDTDPPTFGTRETTDPASDTTSQSKYGIIEKVLSVGGASLADAEQIRDTWLEENAEPETSQQFNNQSQSEPSVTVECIGYVYFLNMYTYNQTANTGDINVSTQIQNVLAADPNGIFSTDYSGITTNTLQVARYTNDDNRGWDYIKSLTARGDSSSNRYLFGIFNDRKAVYAPIPTAIEYVQTLTDPKVRVELVNGQEVKPWNVESGKWLLYSDFLIGQTIPSNLRDDKRIEFIESVTYTTPWGLSHNGSKVSNLNQFLAQLGLSGVG